MQISFWGVRGSLATPGKNTLYFGGNTLCVDISQGNDHLILDAGTGIKALGSNLKAKSLSLFLSHYHLDHICGFPFFDPLYDKKCHLMVHGPKRAGHSSPKKILEALFDQVLFPVPLKALPAKMDFRGLGDATTKVPGFEVKSFFINHPGATLGYVVRGEERSIAYLSDHEPIGSYNHLKIAPKDYEKKLIKNIEGADVLIHDAHFLEKDYPKHKGWGHSPMGYALELAVLAGIPKLILIHYSPDYSDAVLKTALQGRKIPKGMQVVMAREGHAITL